MHNFSLSISHNQALCKTLNLPAMEEKEESPRRARRRKNLIVLVDEVGGAAQFARESEVPKSHVSVLLSGARGLGDVLAARLEQLYAKPPGWFDVNHAEVQSNVSAGPDIRGLVPLISEIQAGAWCDAEDPFQPGDAEDWLPCPARHGPNTYALRVRGDSMTAPTGNTRTYPEGCFIFVDPAKNSPINGDRVVAKLASTNKVTFKIYKEEDGRRWLAPLNPMHPPIHDEFTVCGTVIGKWEDG